jgi:hypothetical protein
MANDGVRGYRPHTSTSQQVYGAGLHAAFRACVSREWQQSSAGKKSALCGCVYSVPCQTNNGRVQKELKHVRYACCSTDQSLAQTKRLACPLSPLCALQTRS